ncbi:right-handed parallel beta-helix repeat-containing protein [Verrucomicrobiaceae bacterium N1E253]|uniref:Right-handed parallel beta-helix repeat-containing protein n=1 Tax=Oceaniferula marina TaxID=2748318 RepID=A0A851GJ83_9BACT|nr:right-handed parallel beta-helix repeat-containing protein [Oceaniferula marina]NWK55245.1 right-handed parallel beta-helix repeat-containing protein [Oceaniferula marina]
MKKHILSYGLAAITLTSSLGQAGTFHVAPDGDDAYPGTKAKPFASLERARTAARQSKKSTVVLAEGTYRRTKTFELNEKDSGTTYRAEEGAEVRITGSIDVPSRVVKPVSSPAILKRLLPEVSDKVLEIDLHAYGIKDFGEVGPRGFRRPYIPAPLELIVNDQPLAIAQWPNPGKPGVRIGKVLDRGSITRNGEKPVRGGVFQFDTDRPARWAKAKDIWITGLFQNGYADNTVKVKSIDMDKKTLTTVHPHMYGFSSGRSWNRWTAMNLIEEIDLPGEFCADEASGKIYFLPPAGLEMGKAKLTITMLKDPMVAIEGASEVVFEGMIFENARGMGVYIERGANNRIQACTLRNFGMVAVCIGKGVSPDPDYRHAFTGKPVSRELGSWHEHIYDNILFEREAGTGHGVVSCDIYNIGEGAISLGGGDRKTLTPAGNFVKNCDISHFNRWDRTYRGAVNIDGVGNRIAHCKIHQAPALAIYLHGNDHIIEYNDIHHVMMEGDDMGAFYMGRDPTERGNIIRYNYWHHLAPAHMTWCLYFDDSGGDSSQVIGNVFYRAGNRSSVFVAGGSDFKVENNLFINCRKAIEPQRFRGRCAPIFKERMAEVNYNKGVWAERYPGFVDYWEKPRPHNNSFKNNWITNDQDERFVNPSGGDFTLKSGADNGVAEWKPIPFGKIGLYVGDGRTSLPFGKPTIQTNTLIFEDELEVKLDVPKNAEGLVYTLDGSEPDASSKRYTKPIRLTKTSTLTVRAVGAGEHPVLSPSVSQTYTKISRENLVAKINFQPSDKAAPDGWLSDDGSVYKKHGKGIAYGWSKDNRKAARRRGKVANDLTDTLVHFAAGNQWQMELENGKYQVVVCLGDSEFHSNKAVLAIGAKQVVKGEHLQAKQFRLLAFEVEVKDGKLTLSSDASTHGPDLTRMNYILVEKM